MFLLEEEVEAGGSVMYVRRLLNCGCCDVDCEEE